MNCEVFSESAVQRSSSLNVMKIVKCQVLKSKDDKSSLYKKK